MRRTPLPRRARRSRQRWRCGAAALVSAVALVLAGLLSLSPTQGTAAADSSDYTQSVVATSTTQARITFTPTTPAAYVDVRYLVNGANQQNFAMTDSGGTWSLTANQLTMGTVLTYWFTYEKGGPQYDTPQFTYTQGSGGTTGGTTGGGGTQPVPGTIPLATGGLVQPAVQNPSYPNRDILFNWSEYTLNDSGLWLNRTQVDMFSAPYAVGVQSTTGTSRTTGHLKTGGYNAVLNSLRAQPDWAGLIQTAPDGSVLRALAPGH